MGAPRLASPRPKCRGDGSVRGRVVATGGLVPARGVAERTGRSRRSVTNDIVQPEPAPVGTVNLWHLFVRPTWQGRGAGRRLMRSALTEAHTRGFARLRLWTPRGAAGARRFCEREGWTVTGNERDESPIGLPIVEYDRASSQLNAKPNRPAPQPRSAGARLAAAHRCSPPAPASASRPVIAGVAVGRTGTTSPPRTSVSTAAGRRRRRLDALSTCHRPASDERTTRYSWVAP
jgi:Acetyltransferase (GNAT) domain